MKRCRFVQPSVVRLPLVDVHRRTLAKLQAQKDTKPEALEAAHDAVEKAAEDGDWIDVKAELNAGETRRIFTDLVKNFTMGSAATLNPEQVGNTKALQYIVGWSFTDAQGHAVPFSVSALENLDADSYQELIDAVEWHDADVERQRQEKKRHRTTENPSKAISMSLVG